MALLKISSQEWRKAKKYFEENDTEVKFSKKMKRRNAKNNHSFIKVGDEIFAIANRHITKEEKASLLGEGAFGKVKMVQTQEGHNFAVKIEGRGARADDDSENKVMKLINYVKGDAVLDLHQPKEFKGKFTTKKLYTVTDLRKGDELFNSIYFDKNATKRKALTEDQALLIALKSCQAIDALHQKGIIHADIKPENFMADIQGNQVVVESIDFGHSMILGEGQNIINAKGLLGSPMFNAPEVTRFNTHSFSSDIYALGVMLNEDLLLNKNSEVKVLIERMTDKNPEKRPKMDEIIVKLTSACAAKNLIVNVPVLNENVMNKFSKEHIENSYKQKSQSSSPAGFLLNFAKSTGKAMFDKGKKRDAQINLIVDTATKLNNNYTLPLEDKIKIMYAILTKIESEIKNKETNMITSGMLKMCVEYKKEIDTSANTELQKTLKDINQKGEEYQNIISPYIEEVKVQKKDNPKLK